MQGHRRRALIGAAATAALGCASPLLAQPRRIRIGSTFDHSSVEKANGNALHGGATAFFKAFNKLHPQLQVELADKDDQFKPDLARINAEALAADPAVLALLHPLGTRQTAAIMDAVRDLAIVGPNTGTAALRKKGAPQVFWVRANYDQEIDKLVSTAATLGVTRIGLVHPNDPLGQSLLAAFNAATAKAGLKPAVIATTPNTTSMEVQAAVQAVTQAAPQVLVMGLAGTLPVFVRALRDAGGTSTLYGLSIGASASNIAALGAKSRGISFSLVVPSPFAAKHEIVRRYQADMRAAGFAEFALPSLEGYINARVLSEGLLRAGAIPSRASLLAALEGIESLDLGGMRIGYGKGRREGGSFVDVAVIGEGGKLMV